jgi:hypothetical protein
LQANTRFDSRMEFSYEILQKEKSYAFA